MTFNPEEMFFLSISQLSSQSMKKYSISKGKSQEFIYYSPYKEDTAALKSAL